MFGTEKWSGPWTRCLWEIETNGCEKCIEIISQSLYVLRIYWLCNLSTRQTLHNDFPRRVLIAVVISNFLVADSEWWFLVNFVQHKSDYGIWPLLKQHTGFRCSLPEPKHWFLAFNDFGRCFFLFCTAPPWRRQFRSLSSPFWSWAPAIISAYLPTCTLSSDQ